MAAFQCHVQSAATPARHNVRTVPGHYDVISVPARPVSAPIRQRLKYNRQRSRHCRQSRQHSDQAQPLQHLHICFLDQQPVYIQPASLAEAPLPDLKIIAACDDLWGGPPGPQPTPPSACWVWMNLISLARSGSRGTGADQQVCPTTASGSPVLGKLSDIGRFRLPTNRTFYIDTPDRKSTRLN